MLHVPPSITALILCGGRGTRMGGVDKPLQSFQGQPLVQHVLDRIAPQVGGRVLLSANRSLEDYRQLGYPVLVDSLSDFQGPLAGLLAGLAHVNGQTGPSGLAEGANTAAPSVAGDAWLLCVSGDSPWLPVDLVERLWGAISSSDKVTASSDRGGAGTRVDAGAGNGAGAGAGAGAGVRADSAMALGREAPSERLRSQPLASLVHTRHHRALADALAGGERRVEAWLRSLPLVEVPFDRPQDAHAFANINDRSQLERPAPAP